MATDTVEPSTGPIPTRPSPHPRKKLSVRDTAPAPLPTVFDHEPPYPPGLAGNVGATADDVELAYEWHEFVCDCGDLAAHERSVGRSLVVVAHQQRERLRRQLAGQITYPVAPKVWASTGGAFWANAGLVTAISLLDGFGVIGDVFPGQRWTAGAISLAAVIGPPLVAFLKGYQAPHQPRPATPEAP